MIIKTYYPFYPCFGVLEATQPIAGFASSTNRITSETVSI